MKDCITERGAPLIIISDGDKEIVSDKVNKVLRTLHIGKWCSEAYHQHQNIAERRYDDIKSTVKVVLDRTGDPSYMWMFCMEYVCHVLNTTYNATLKCTPIKSLTIYTPDISVLLRFQFFQEVYYHVDDDNLPSSSSEKKGNIVGIYECVGHPMTYKILVSVTRNVIHRSSVREVTPDDLNIREDKEYASHDDESISGPVLRSMTMNGDDANLHILDMGTFGNNGSDEHKDDNEDHGYIDTIDDIDQFHQGLKLHDGRKQFTNNHYPQVIKDLHTTYISNGLITTLHGSHCISLSKTTLYHAISM